MWTDDVQKLDETKIRQEKKLYGDVFLMHLVIYSCILPGEVYQHFHQTKGLIVFVEVVCGDFKGTKLLQSKKEA